MRLNTIHFPVKTYFLLTAFALALFFPSLKAQEVYYSFANFQSTKAGPLGSVEFDVMIASSSEFTLGSGQLYLNYNPAAFGENALTKGNIVATVPPGEGYLLDQKDNASGWLPAYTQRLELNNNTTSRVSIAFRQSINGAYIETKVNEKPQKLFHVRFNYVKANFAGLHGICFEQNAPFDKQTFTACGSFNRGGSSGVDCKNFPGVKILNESFDCAYDRSPVTSPLQYGGPHTIFLYPVPAKDFVQVQFDSDATRVIDVKLWDQRGRITMIREQSLIKGFNTWKMDTSSLPSGVYYLELVGDELAVTKKFIVAE